MSEEEKKAKKAAKKARIKAEARFKHRMEVSRTMCSMGALILSALSVAHVYGVL